jgi:Uma2 family endonuclease
MLRPMTAVAKSKMTVEQYLAWSEGREGRWELIDGAPVRMEAERVEHSEIKFAAGVALHEAIRRAKAPCQALPDGATVRISKVTAFEPDVMVRCGPRLARGTLEVPDPVIVVEVLSPSTAARDYGEKVDGYFSLPSVQHYLILSPEQRKVVHCRRGQGDVIERRVIASGTLRLDPPGLEVAVESLFGEE